MDDFIQSNPGFKSRVPHTMYFADYTCSDMQELSALFLKLHRLWRVFDSARAPHLRRAPCIVATFACSGARTL